MIRSVVERLTRRRFAKRKFQEKIDIWRLFVFAHHFKECDGRRVDVNIPNERTSFARQYHVVHSTVNEQVIKMLQNVKERLTKQPNMTQSWSFTLHTQKSTVQHPDAGEGLFIDGHVVPGTVVTFFPGTVYLPPDVSQITDYSDSDPHKTLSMMSRLDRCIIDANNYDITITTPDGPLNHPFAYGHKVNHPEPGVVPNLIPFSYEATASFPDELLSLIPNKYFRPPGFLYATPSKMRSLVFVAARHLENEELFTDYRLRPDVSHPDWYTSVDEEENRRLWTD
ncbi:uncharacterized protein LOC134179739 [Corticium candelabrum]|uniref:uncharacterized protein LOC134179739 n=1 Tax=Corticium candelabrum TaxID=121492 RepID=UPI002E26EBBF|nr:uncharacterized protein LOC134179739 [Corticium candelabrum]